jgi:hypothetical protein
MAFVPVVMRIHVKNWFFTYISATGLRHPLAPALHEVKTLQDQK